MKGSIYIFGVGAGNNVTFNVSMILTYPGPSASHPFYFNNAKELEHMASFVDVLTVTFSRLPSLVLLLAGIQLSVGQYPVPSCGEGSHP